VIPLYRLTDIILYWHKMKINIFLTVFWASLCINLLDRLAVVHQVK